MLGWILIAIGIILGVLISGHGRDKVEREFVRVVGRRPPAGAPLPQPAWVTITGFVGWAMIAVGIVLLVV